MLANRCLAAAALVLGATLLSAPSVDAQEEDTIPAPPAEASDVESVDAVIAALYDVISGPAGQERDWDRFRSLFAPGARLIPTGRDASGVVRTVVFTPEDYMNRVGPMLKERGFYELEIGRIVEQFGAVTHAFSAYSSRWTPEDAEPFQRGINSIQLFDDGTRWWIMSVFWDSERDDNPIADRYLNKNNG